jgi:hypothetical protein
MIISVDRRVYHKMTTSGEKYNIVRDKFNKSVSRCSVSLRNQTAAEYHGK